MVASNIGSRIIHLESVDSTNEYISRLLDQGENVPEGTIVWADFQTMGKGYMGNTWESEAGKNLLVSILLYTRFLKVQEQFYISEMISLALHDLLSRYSAEVKIKWPNDIYIKNKKIAGILIENTIEKGTLSRSIIGIGLNINQMEFSSELPNPTSLHLETRKDYYLTDILDEFNNRLNERYSQLQLGKLEHIRSEYQEKLYGFRTESRFIHEKECFTGTIIEVNSFGELLIEDKNKKIRTYAFKEVEFVLT